MRTVELMEGRRCQAHDAFFTLHMQKCIKRPTEDRPFVTRDPILEETEATVCILRALLPAVATRPQDLRI